MQIKKTVRQLRSSNFLVLRWLYFVLQWSYATVRITVNSRSRSEIFTRMKYGSDHLQNSTYTFSNRYPVLFKQVQQYFSKHEALRILSFGCSTGEEVFTLKQYIPKAAIIGVDINEWCIKQCRKRNDHNDCIFMNRTLDGFDDLSGFDAIFCMAVFQRSENRAKGYNTIVSGFGFEQFEKEIKILDTKLKEGGLLIIDNTDFSFEDTACAYKYIPLDFAGNRLKRNRPIFGSNNQKIAEVTNNNRIFVKQLP